MDDKAWAGLGTAIGIAITLVLGWLGTKRPKTKADPRAPHEVSDAEIVVQAIEKIRMDVVDLKMKVADLHRWAAEADQMAKMVALLDKRSKRGDS